MNNNENNVDVGGGMFLACLCGKHKDNSTCEVYTRKKAAEERLANSVPGDPMDDLMCESCQ